MKLSGLIIFYLMVMVVEIVGGVKANSLAVITDAAHLLTDVAGFSISLFTVWASGWEATPNQSFGFSRLEVLGALLSVQLIWLISGVLFYEAIDRILHKNTKVNGAIMLAIASLGFFINLIMVTWLGHDHTYHACDHDHHHHHHHHHHEGEGLVAGSEEEETDLVSSYPVKTKILNINIQGAYLHVMADLIQSAGVMIAGGIIWAKPQWLVVDLICTIVFAAFALSTTLPMLRNIFGILMERTPSEINVSRLQSDLRCIKGIQGVHDLHVWAITVGKIALSCHVVAESGASSIEILCKIRDYCERTHKIHHVTVQIE
ncbi:Cation_efflux domain-containing protein [Cephalotus follicularis]|uniref:Cation_efflux domain-containing protein n=1 Tax=Cephalotus follicularis TaxID=3775 RepID=A0A1Q3CDJ7_CEPFO|nr:Cation_efflux domain-containing protein [Cephalotus follicularis]